MVGDRKSTTDMYHRQNVEFCNVGNTKHRLQRCKMTKCRKEKIMNDKHTVPCLIHYFHSVQRIVFLHFLQFNAMLFWRPMFWHFWFGRLTQCPSMFCSWTFCHSMCCYSTFCRSPFVIQRFFGEPKIDIVRTVKTYRTGVIWREARMFSECRLCSADFFVSQSELIRLPIRRFKVSCTVIQALTIMLGKAQYSNPTLFRLVYPLHS